MENNTVQFDDFTDAACAFSDTFDYLPSDYRSVGIVAKYNEAKEIIKQLVCLGHDVYSIDIHNCDFDDYCDEYVITITDDGIFCEKFVRDYGYFTEESDVTYVSEEANSACLKHIDSDMVVSFQIGDDDNEDEELEDEENCCKCSCEDNMHEFTMTKNTDNGYSSISFYSTDKICADEMKHLMDALKF